MTRVEFKPSVHDINDSILFITGEKASLTTKGLSPQNVAIIRYLNKSPYSVIQTFQTPKEHFEAAMLVTGKDHHFTVIALFTIAANENPCKLVKLCLAN